MKFVVDGITPLIGSVRVSGSKNSASKIIIASLFSNEDIVLDNVPRIGNVTDDLEVIEALGVKTSWLAPNKLLINSSSINSFEVPLELGARNRTASLLAAPLLYRFGKALIPKPLGCKIGFRPINRWLKTWESLGIEVKEEEDFYVLRSKKLERAEISFKVVTVMGTENAILTALFIPGETVIKNCALEPEVDDLIRFVNQIGALVKRVEDRDIVVSGNRFFLGAKFRVMPDRIEAATFVTAALLTCGDVKIEESVSADLLPLLRKFESLKANFEFIGETLRVWKSKVQKLEPFTLETSPYPGFSTDWQPLMGVLATQIAGTSLIHDTIHVDRFAYTKELNRMGARISLLTPSQAGLDPVVSDDMYDIALLGEPLSVAKIEGFTSLKRERLNVPDLRAGAALVLAALCAEGRSEIFGVENIDRGYENFDEKLKSLGAKIVRTE
ncbi:UDP-N-acetylglucosamine 1-carboxyvinyltransferase [candidate division WWE3 bacterium]|nr:UDP-N-acetylglucosamine 1-carboxyvinyltransferase [candidate division WWE3 bacterium]